MSLIDTLSPTDFHLATIREVPAEVKQPAGDQTNQGVAMFSPEKWLHPLSWDRRNLISSASPRPGNVGLQAAVKIGFGFFEEIIYGAQKKLAITLRSSKDSFRYAGG